MVIFPNCKINLGLHVLCKRTDGFHDLESVFYPLPLYDALEIIEDPQTNTPRFSVSGFSLDIEPGKNIVYKAWELLHREHGVTGSLSFHLHKAIPSGAGLGGGSADGAFTLLLLNKKFNLGIGPEELVRYAATLGSDCPFFILNQPMLVKGRGEILAPLGLDLASWFFVVVHPGIHISTAWAFSQIKPGLKNESIPDIIREPVTSWKYSLRNDFEVPVFEKHPEIAGIKKELYDKGAIYASMSGSGSSVFGIFEKKKLPDFSFPSQYFIKTIE